MFDCDVVVAGGGPAGATAASWLGRAGRRVVLLERDRFPRFHIGESLLASVNDPLLAIGAHDLVRQAGFPEKWGATFMTGDGRVQRHADFSGAPGVPRPQTWQVPRAEFDHLLLQHAAGSGVDVREGHRVLDAAFDADGVTVTVQGQAAPHTLRTRAFIDASGRGALLSRKFNLRIDEPRLANLAIFSHYSGIAPLEGRRRGDIRIVARDDMGWFWLIPVSDTLMSVGLVVPGAAARTLRDTEPGALLDQFIEDTPAVAQLMTSAKREWPVRVEKDFSFGTRTYAGDRWLLAGDAGSFLDPVFSSGVAIALESGLEAGRAVDDGLAANDLTARRFQAFSRRQFARFRVFRRFVLGFYTPEFRDLFFSQDPPPLIFKALVTIFAGYWRPSFATRLRVELFFQLVRMRGWVRAAQRLRAGR